MLSRAGFLRLATGAGVVGAAGAARAQSLPKPTTAEMQAAIRQGMNEVYLSENGRSIYGNTGIAIAYTEPKFGQLVMKQMVGGRQPQPVWPVRMTATVTVTSTKRPTETIVWAGKPGDVFYFFKNSFNEWAYRVGNEG